ncbi:MAG: T9SS type A sorting domain-containing protein, partial [Ignavibacteria bacterium]|nr:T9SS type A sorting domain-containing protein [Ignavibacteria bacterium]
QNYPNPFNPITEITFGLPTDEFVTIEIFNSIGQKISILMNEVKTAGVYHIPFDGLKYASGMYIYKFKAGSFIETKKMLLVK